MQSVQPRRRVDQPVPPGGRAGHAPRTMLRAALVVLAVAGCVISLVLVRLSLPGDAPATVFGADLCAPSQTVNCDHVLNSRWSRIGPIPVAALGLAYFAALAAWFTVVGLPNRSGRRWHLVPMAVICVGLCGSVGMMLLMAVSLPFWCTWCAAAHAVNGLIFILGLLAWPRSRAAGERDADDVPPEAETPYPSAARALAVGASCGAFALMIAMGGVAYRAQYTAYQFRERYLAATNNVDYVEWRYRRAPEQAITIHPDDLSLGPADAPFTIVAFTDFECSKCEAFFSSAGSLLERFPGTLRCVFKHFPLASTCNPHVEGRMHYFSCEAALAAEAAHAVGTAEQSLAYHKALYASSGRLDDRPYVQLAKEVGLDPAAFSAALDQPGARRRLDADIALGGKLGVEATPTIFLNGRRLPTWKITAGGGNLDVDQTVALWERLLGAEAKRRGD